MYLHSRTVSHRLFVHLATQGYDFLFSDDGFFAGTLGICQRMGGMIE
jgi:hypothetical protein